jgi:simple sugar transport system permease protein
MATPTTTLAPPKPGLINIRQSLRIILLVLSPLLIFGVFLLLAGVNPITTYGSMVSSVMLTPYGWQEVMVRAAPYLLAALATIVPARAGLMNVGGEGQLMIGALTTTIIGLVIGPLFPAWINLPLLIVAGMLGGLLWALIPGVLRVYFNLNETICTLLLNYVAFLVISLFVHGPLKDPASFNWPFSPPLADSAKWTQVWGRAHFGILVAPIAAVLVWFIFSKTIVGLRLRVVGGNAEAAKRAGLHVSRTQILAILAGGALAGMAGMIQVTGVEGRLLPTTGVGFGYIGFLAAWIVAQNPLLAILSSIILSLIAVSGDTLQLSAGLPASSVNILTATVVLGVLAVLSARKK